MKHLYLIVLSLLLCACASINDKNRSLATSDLNCAFFMQSSSKGLVNISCEEKKEWENYGGTVHSQPMIYLEPTNAQQISEIVKLAHENSWRVRPVGSGHSWSQATQSDHILMGTHKVTRQMEIIKEGDKAYLVVGAGERLRVAVDYLKGKGYAFSNLGSTQSQTIAGAVSTNTHGTGITKPGFAGLVQSLKLVDGQGNLKEISGSKDKELFYSALAGIGMVGVIYELTMKIEPHFILTMRNKTKRVKKVFDENNTWRKYLDENEWLSFFYPLNHNSLVILTGNRSTEEEIKGREIRVRRANRRRLETRRVGGLREKSKWFEKFKRNFITNSFVSPLAIHPVLWDSAFPIAYSIYRFLPTGGKKVFEYAEAISSDFEVEHWDWNIETELFFPVKFLPEVMIAAKEYYEDSKKQGINFAAPFFGVRFVKGDNAYLSPTYIHEGYSEFVAINLFDRQEKQSDSKWFKDIKELIQNIVKDPKLLRMHLGKVYLDGPTSFKNRFHHWSTFNETRKKSDPNGVFLNKWTEKFFE